MKKLFFLLVIAALALTACNGQATEVPATADAFIITNPAIPIEATAGEEFQIIVDSNPSTGYHWELVGTPDGRVVQFISRDYKPSEPVMPGSGGKDVWTFKAVAAGTIKIVLGSYPPGQGQAMDHEASFTVVVK